MTAVYWKAPRKLRVPGQAHHIQIHGWHWFLWKNKAGKWQGKIIAPLAAFPGVAFSPLIDRDLAAEGLLFVGEISGYQIYHVLAEMADRLGKAFTPDLAKQIREQLENA